jgi:uroporphyrinogen-III synthase
MLILVTRPEPDAERTAARLRALGHKPVTAPLLAIVPAAPPADLPDPAALILTSRNGVRAVTSWPQAAGWRERPVFVTGGGTAETTRRAGFTDVRSGDGDADDLAALILSEVGPELRPILYPAARDRSEGFLNRLRADGYDIRVVDAYRAEMVVALDPAIVAALRSARIDGVLFYSQRTAVAFRQLADREGLRRGLAGTRLYALSARVAEPLRDLGAEIVVAGNPDEDSLLSLLPQGSG